MSRRGKAGSRRRWRARCWGLPKPWDLAAARGAISFAALMRAGCTRCVLEQAHPPLEANASRQATATGTFIPRLCRVMSRRRRKGIKQGCA